MFILNVCICMCDHVRVKHVKFSCPAEYTCEI